MALAIGLPIVVLVGAEYGLRYAYRHVRSSGSVRDYYGTKALQAFRTNHLGFREIEFGPKDPQRYRIVVVGDSLTWGMGIEERERFSNRVERILGPRYEVLNFGMPGHNLPEHLDVLETALAAAAPDFVLLQLYPNDFETRRMRRPVPRGLLPWPDLDRRMLASSVLYDLAAEDWRAVQDAVGMTERYTQYMRRELGDPESPSARDTTDLLRRFITRARDGGARVGIVFFPWPDALGDGYQLGFLHDRVAGICGAEQIRCVDLRADYAAGFRSARSVWVNRWDSHPNARANRRAADEIVAAFASGWHE